MRITEADRIAARVERQEAKQKMSSKAASRLRELADQKERDDKAEQRFASQFESLPKGSRTLRQLLERISRPANEAHMTKEEVDSYYDRRTLKLRRCLANGWKPSFVHDVVFFAELTPGEWKMSEEDLSVMRSNMPACMPNDPEAAIWTEAIFARESRAPEAKRTVHDGLQDLVGY